MRLADERLKGGFETKNLFYLSVTWLSQDTFGGARLLREVADAWIQQKFSHAGQKYTNEVPELTDCEINAIPGARTRLSGLDAVEFTVLERVGDRFQIKSDEHRYWTSQGGKFAESYESLRAEHEEILSVQRLGLGPSARQEREEAAAETAEPSTNSGATCEVLDSLDALKSQYGVQAEVVSEVAGINILVAKDASIWLLSTKEKKHVPKYSLLGGYGTGQYVASSDAGEGVDFNVTSDSTTVQLDMSSFRAEGSGVSTMTMYKMLLLAEREHNMTTHTVTWLKVQRKDQVEAGTDGFDISVKTPMKFKCLSDPRASSEGPKTTCKNVFAQCLKSTSTGTTIGKCFRFRYERIGGTFKVQRPYVVTLVALCLEHGKPMKVASL